MSFPPPPAPPPPVLLIHDTTPPSIPSPPLVPSSPPSPTSHLISLLIYNGHPFKDHWAYFVHSRDTPDLGVEIHATGDVRNGFEFQIKRAFDLREDENRPTKRVPLQWVCGRVFGQLGGDGREIGVGDGDEAEKMLNGGVFKLDDTPVCLFEEALKSVRVPGKTLVSVDETEWEGYVGRKIVQRNCQTWIVESAAQLVKEGIFDEQAAAYVRAIEQ